MRRWISMLRPLGFMGSRLLRWRPERGSIEYSAVIQPEPLPFMKPGTRSSTVAVTSMWVSPIWIMHEPSANFA